MITVLSAGPFATVQDLGRRDYFAQGVSISGAMDRTALQAGNLMVGNAPGAAGIETTGAPLRLRFEGPRAFALTGADAEITLDDVTLPMWWAGHAEAGQVLSVMPSRGGMWTYVCLGGGIACEPVMNSRSTDLKIGIGGPFSGKAIPVHSVLDLGADDVNLASCIEACGGFGIAPPKRARSTDGSALLRVMVAREYSYFMPEHRAAFWLEPWQVQRDSNRMGYKLAGPELHTEAPLSLPSYPLVPGTVQVPPAGQPMVQLAEANTCGGYPKIGVIIAPDLPALVQTPPGGTVRMHQVSRAGAAQARQDRNRFFDRVRAATGFIATVVA